MAGRCGILHPQRSPFDRLRAGLGSTSVLSDESGQQAGERVAYLPYGGLRLGDASTLPTDYGFTGQRLEAGLGLMHYGARFYSPRLGRFISADTLVCHPRNPQAWNRYSYVLNNPLYYVDPTGHQQAAIGAVALVLELVDPLPLDPLVIPAALTLIASDPSVQQALMYTSQHAQYYPAVAEQADTWVRAGEAVQQASETANSAGLFDSSNFKFDPGKLDPERFSSQDIGQEAHRQFRKEFQDQMAEKGRTEKPGDFLTENAIRDTEGNVVRIDGQFGKPDAVDYKSHIIYDLKPWEPGGEQAILKHYSAQFEFYKQLYFKAYEIEPTIKIVIHSAPQP